ncbi:MAG: hypothetical protein ABF296_11645 [Oceanococcaceae bacterium]
MKRDESTDWLALVPDLVRQSLGPPLGELAADLWNRRFAHDGSRQIIEFMRIAAAEFQLSAAQRQSLRSAIHRARSGLLDPTPDITEGLSAGRVVARRLLHVFRQVIVEGHPRQRSEFTQTLAREVAPHKGLHEMAAPVLGWMVQGGRMPELSLGDLQLVVHATYVSACKVLGPIRADTLLQQASAAAQSLPEATLFPPAKLLYPDD